jgi:hypothetical protein
MSHSIEANRAEAETIRAEIARGDRTVRHIRDSIAKDRRLSRLGRAHRERKIWHRAPTVCGAAVSVSDVDGPGARNALSPPVQAVCPQWSADFCPACVAGLR